MFLRIGQSNPLGCIVNRQLALNIVHWRSRLLR